MLVNGSILIYVLAAIIAVSAVTIMLLLIRGKNIGQKDYLKYLTIFILANFFLGGIYLWEMLNIETFMAGGINLFYRVSDILLYVVQAFAWVKFILSYTGMEGTRANKLAVPFYGLLAVLSVVTYGFLLDESFEPVNQSVLYIELAIAICMTGYNIWGGTIGYKSGSAKNLKIYIAVVTLLVICNGIWNAATTVCTIVSGTYYIVPFDYTSICLALISIATVWYIYITDFSEVFFSDEGKAMPKDKIVLLEEASERYGFTDREKEVFFLAYEGLSNPEIAEQLFISKYTVKHHMHSIFEKMNVSGRVDMLIKVQEDE